MNVAGFICNFLIANGIDKVFVYPGGTIAPFLHEMEKRGIKIVCFRNEQGAGYAAIGAAKVSGKPQVVAVTSGPGATNIVTPVADAYYDSIPLIVFTGQVATPYINIDKKVRQTGFQETDVVGLFKSITKQSTILTPNDFAEEKLFNALRLVISERPGPVVIDLPMDTQKKDIESKIVLKETKLYINKDRENKEVKKIDISSKLKEVINLIDKAERPLILAGNGVFISKAVKELRDFVERTNIPLISSMPAVGVMPKNHPLYFGFLGHTGEFYANLAMYYSDLILVFGSRLDIRQIGDNLNVFKSKKVVRVDIDYNEIKYSKIKSHVYFNMDIKVFLQKAVKLSFPTKKYQDWLHILKEWKENYSSSKFYKGDKLFMKDVVEYVSKKCKNRKVVVSSGVGGHQQIVARYFDFDFPKRVWITSAGHGTMGFDLPSVLGAFLEKKDYFDFGLVFVGDGSFQMNIQELATLREFKFPIKIFVLDDRRLGIVSQFQLLNWGKDPATGNKNNPSFAKIAMAYDINGLNVSSKNELDKLDAVFADNSPWVVHCYINSKEDVLPMLLAGQELNEMYPFEKVEIKL